MSLVDRGDWWLLPVAGRTVEAIRIDFAVTFYFGHELEFELRMEQPVLVKRSGGGELLLDLEGDPQGLAALDGLVHEEVVEAVAFKDGHLEIVFARGTPVLVPLTRDTRPGSSMAPVA